MQLLGLPAALFTAVDGAFAAVLPPAARLALWGALAAALSMAIYKLTLPARHVAAAKARALRARRRLLACDGELAEAWPLMRGHVTAALRQVVLVTPPAALAMAPVILVAGWLEAAYGYSFPPPGRTPAIRTLPEDLRAFWIDGAGTPQPAPPRLEIADAAGHRLLELPLRLPLPVLHRPGGWDQLSEPPAADLPRNSPVRRIELQLPPRRYFRAGPAWLDGWETLFVAGLLAAGLALRSLEREPQARRARGEGGSSSMRNVWRRAAVGDASGTRSRIDTDTNAGTDANSPTASNAAIETGSNAGTDPGNDCGGGAGGGVAVMADAAAGSPAPPAMRAAPAATAEGFTVAGWMDRLGGFIERHRDFCVRLGNLETRLVADRLSGVEIERPVYICGLARSGTTVLLELLAAHPSVATHRYRDFPPIFTPYLWNRWLAAVPQRAEQPQERTHADRIRITSASPEAFEEPLWMTFFPQLHDPQRSAVLDRTTRNPAFEHFYRDHIRKLLCVRNAARYVAKANYNLTRLAYLHRLFPDARFVVLVRSPASHIASLQKQQRLFEAGCRDNPQARAHLRRVGHFEFGPDRRPINAGDFQAIRAVLQCWAEGRETEGWARYWAAVHRFVIRQLANDAALRRATLLVRYEDLAHDPVETLKSILGHCRLKRVPELLEAGARRLSLPAYYTPQFSAAEEVMIERETAAVARRLGYQRRRTATPPPRNAAAS
jgi:hypothetical protein